MRQRNKRLSSTENENKEFKLSINRNGYSTQFQLDFHVYDLIYFSNPNKGKAGVKQRKVVTGKSKKSSLAKSIFG